MIALTYFMLLISFDSPKKRQNFLMFSGGIKRSVALNRLTQITNTEIYAFLSVLAFKLLSRKFLFISREDNRNC